jgi:hypothetical protein
MKNYSWLLLFGLLAMGQPALAQETATGAPASADVPFVTVGTDIDGYWTDLFHEDLWDRRSGLLVGGIRAGSPFPKSSAGRTLGFMGFAVPRVCRLPRWWTR